MINKTNRESFLSKTPYIVFLIFLIIILFLSLLPEQELVKDGKIDLSQWNFSKNGVCFLNGDWEFYWNSLKDDLTYQNYSEKIFVGVPGIWNRYNFDERELPGKGFATYRMTARLPEGELYFLKLLNMSSSYNLFINDKLVANNGRVAKSKEEYIPEYKTQTIFFQSENEWNEIVMEISNYDHYKGGFWETIALGDLNSISKYSLKKQMIDVLLLGFLMTTSLIYLSLSIFLKKEKTFVYLALFLLILAVRVLTVGEKNIVLIFPEISWNFLIKLEYLSYYLAIPIFLLFFMNFIKKFQKNIFLKFSIIFYFINSLVVIFADIGTITFMLSYINYYTIILGISLFCFLLASERKNEPSSKEFLIAFIILFGIVIIEIISIQLGKSINQTSILGVLIFVLAILFEVNRKFSKEVENTKRSNEELEDMANRDGLTGLYNHRFMCESLNRISQERDQRTRHSLGLFDLDDFKMVNDIYGHQSGDFVLREVAKVMKENTRINDILGRYGGEEFMIIFRDTDLEDAFMVSDRLREKIQSSLVERMGIKITLSGGLIEIKEETSSQAIDRVDKLLYRAKAKGKNKIEM